jgi:protocatechuate 3,4-dioxygenase alpha subunit
MTNRGITPSQTVGPFFAFSLTPGDAYDYRELVTNDLRTEDAVGEPVRIVGRVLDGAGDPVPDAMIEIWQADGSGRYPTSDARPNTAFLGFGRSATGSDGAYSFLTVKPGRVLGPDGNQQAPHVNVGVFARGLLKRLFTRIYFPDHPANVSDPVLALVPADRRRSLIAARNSSGAYVFDIRLQGDNETVFFEA